MTGHWEIMGLYIDKPFRVFPEGFPDELIHELEQKSGRKVIGNKPASVDDQRAGFHMLRTEFIQNRSA